MGDLSPGFDNSSGDQSQNWFRTVPSIYSISWWRADLQLETPEHSWATQDRTVAFPAHPRVGKCNSFLQLSSGKATELIQFRRTKENAKLTKDLKSTTPPQEPLAGTITQNVQITVSLAD